MDEVLILSVSFYCHFLLHCALYTFRETNVPPQPVYPTPTRFPCDNRCCCLLLLRGLCVYFLVLDNFYLINSVMNLQMRDIITSGLHHKPFCILPDRQRFAVSPFSTECTNYSFYSVPFILVCDMWAYMWAVRLRRHACA